MGKAFLSVLVACFWFGGCGSSGVSDPEPDGGLDGWDGLETNDFDDGGDPGGDPLPDGETDGTGDSGGDPDQPGITLTSWSAPDLSETGFSVEVEFSGDSNQNAGVILLYCNENDSPGRHCEPRNDGVPVDLTRESGKFTGSVAGLSAIGNFGDTFQLRFEAEDPDGVEGSPTGGEIRLPANGVALLGLFLGDAAQSGFFAGVPYRGDENQNATGVIHYCNHTDTPGCSPQAGNSAELERDTLSFYLDIQELSSPDDPGDVLNVAVEIDDPDWVSGLPLEGQVILQEPVWSEVIKLQAGDGSEGDNFGSSVVVHDDLVVVGAPRAGAIDHGAVYVFRRIGEAWQPEQKLEPPEPAQDQFFGNAVDVSGNTLVVGSLGDDGISVYSGRGAVFVYEFDGASWLFETKLTAWDSDQRMDLGNSVAVESGVIAAGAPEFAVDGKVDAGAVYLFRETGGQWTGETRIDRGSSAEEYNHFGYDVDLSGNLLLTGEHGYNIMDSHLGRAFLYQYRDGQWHEDTVLGPFFENPSTHFGRSVALKDNQAVVDAYADEVSYFFANRWGEWRFEGWQQTSHLISSLPGTSVATEDGIMVVGDNTTGYGLGNAIVCRYNGRFWTEEAVLQASDGNQGDSFGHEVSVFGTWIAVGADQDDDLGENSGSVYLFRLEL